MCMEWGTQQHQGLATTEMAVTIVVSIDTSSVHMQCFVESTLDPSNSMRSIERRMSRNDRRSNKKKKEVQRVEDD